MQSKQQTMSPHDIVILLKISTYDKKKTKENLENEKKLGPIGKYVSKIWHQTQLAEALGISQSEISKSINRSKYAGLLDPSGKMVMKLALMDFLQYGLKYVFPQKPGPIVRGVHTAHSASPLKELFHSSEEYVWPYGKGKVKGQSIIPLHPSVPEVVLKDAELHSLLALVDAIRVGRVREKEMAIAELRKRLSLGK